jgi:phosphoribosylcarboxyaminoimidazole (NCAIR) mutase
MATINQIQKGFARFVDTHIAGAFDGWQKAIVAGGAGLLAANLPNIIKVYGNTPVVAALGVYSPDSGTVNIDALYNAFVPHLGSDKIPVTIPKVGTIRLGKEEIDLLVRYIKEA